jgi:homogentisate 1,2-dioxygenase
VFGRGALGALGEELDRLECDRVFLVSTPGRASLGLEVVAQLAKRGITTFTGAKEHVPVEVVEEAHAALVTSSADCIVAIGGGSAIGLGKALALRTSAKLVAIPTTYSGSEMTPLYGITEAGEKRTGRDERARAVLVLYDPELTLQLPRDVTVQSLWNAMAHAVEALYADDADPVTLLSAERSLGLIATSLPRLVADAHDSEARDDALEGAYLAGSCIADVTLGLHHKLCHILGGRFRLPHAAVHAALLPFVVRYNQDHAPDAMRTIAKALGVVDAASGMAALSRAVGAPQDLRSLGLSAEDLERVADAVMASPPKNPRPIERSALMALLTEAHHRASRPRPVAARPAAESLRTQPGFGSTLVSEALEGALPRDQNTPRRAPLGLYPELYNFTPFTVRRTDNGRAWLYRIRPSTLHTPFSELPSARYTTEFDVAAPNRMRWRPLPFPEGNAVDFLDGLATLGGAGHPDLGPGFAVSLYAANASMVDRCFSTLDGDLLIVPQEGTIECRTELGWLVAPPGHVVVIPRGLKFAISLPDGRARGYVLEVFGVRFRLPERGPLGSNGLADARHFLAPVASYEDRNCPDYQLVERFGGRLYAARQNHSPFDVVAWHGNVAPYVYDLMLFNAMGAMNFDHPDPSIHTVLTAPLDDHGRAVADFVVFPPRWEVAEHSFRPPPFHRNAATEVNGVIRNPPSRHGFEPGCTYLTPLLTGHGISTDSLDHVLDQSDEEADPPNRIPNTSLWFMFESALPMRLTRWAMETDIRDGGFDALFEGVRSRFDPKRR